MPQSFDSIILHIVFSTKERFPTMTTDFRDEMHAYLAKTGRAHCGGVYKVGGVSDHVHLAVSLGRTTSVSDLVRELKTESSKWAKKHEPAFAWQAGYGVFSVSKSHLDALVEYIGNQEEHHRNRTFQEEFRALLRKHNLEWDEAYMWD